MTAELPDHDAFAGEVGTTFAVTLESGERFDLELSAAEPLAPPQAEGPFRREPFRLLFHGPLATVLPQRTYRLEHERLGPMEIFIVPLGPDADRMRYEAIFT